MPVCGTMQPNLVLLKSIRSYHGSMRIKLYEKMLPNIGRVRNVKQDPDGYIYLATEEPGKVYRIVPINE